jgi:hypothetical protein
MRLARHAGSVGFVVLPPAASQLGKDLRVDK